MNLQEGTEGWENTLFNCFQTLPVAFAREREMASKKLGLDRPWKLVNLFEQCSMT